MNRKPKTVVRDWFEGRCGPCGGGGQIFVRGKWTTCPGCKGTGQVR